MPLTYDSTTGQTSSARHLVFSDPMAQLFTFDAVIKARVQVDPSLATRYQPEPGIDFSRFDVGQFTETLSGIVPVGDTGLVAASGLDYRLHAMGTTLEGELDEVLAVVRRCLDWKFMYPWTTAATILLASSG